jgi:hypothetical protein
MSRQLPAGRLGSQRLRRFARLAQRASLRCAIPPLRTALRRYRDEPPFLLGAGPPLEMLLLPFHIYFSDSLPRSTNGHFWAVKSAADLFRV